MSNSQTNPEPSQATTPAVPSNGSSKRLGILLCVLAISLAAMGYDRFVARPAVTAAYAAIIAENDRVNAKPGETFTNKDVQKLIGKSPAETLTTPDKNTVEIYQWRAGLPIRTHDLFVVYKPRDGSLMFQEGGMGNYKEMMEEIADNSREAKIIQLTEEDMANMSRADGEANAGGSDAGRDSNAAQEALEQAEEDKENSTKQTSPTEGDNPESNESESSKTAPNEDAADPQPDAKPSDDASDQ
jgi:hypothetical protein